MKEITGKVQAYSKTTYGIKIDNQWYNLPDQLKPFVNEINTGDLISLVIDDNKNVIKAIKLGEGFEDQIDQHQYAKNNDEYINIRKQEVGLKQQQREDIMKQVCLKCATELACRAIENNFINGSDTNHVSAYVIDIYNTLKAELLNNEEE